MGVCVDLVGVLYARTNLFHVTKGPCISFNVEVNVLVIANAYMSLVPQTETLKVRRKKSLGYFSIHCLSSESGYLTFALSGARLHARPLSNALLAVIYSFLPQLL